MGVGFAEPDGSFTQRQIDYYAARAKGGVGLIITESSRVEREIEDLLTYNLVALDSNMLIQGAGDFVDAMHDWGAKVCLQLSSGLGKDIDWASPNKIPVSSSPQPAFVNPDVLARELTIEEIERIVQANADSAGRALMAGFDMIEIHAHIGFLLDQFMGSVWNKRTDKYGGDLDGRLRIVIEIIRAIRARVGPDFPMSFRYAADHKIEGGRTLEEAEEIARRLEAEGIDALHVDAGCYQAQPWIFPPEYWPQGCIVDLAEAIKKVVKIPVIAVGSINDPQLAEQVLSEGKTDFICIGRQLMADPDWPNKAREGRVEDIRPCLRCNEYCIGRLWSFKTASCTVNPLVGKERYYDLNPVQKPKKVMVIGGGPAGMEAARVAALRGHQVVLYEKDNEFGGQLKAPSRISFKEPVRGLINYLSVQLRKLGVKVELGKEVTPELVDLIKPDAVIVATGANPLVPQFPGVENDSVITAPDLHLGKKKAGDTVVVAGGGLVGLETALSLALEGKKVTAIKTRREILRDLNPVNRGALLAELSKIGVTILTDLIIQKFTDQGLVATDMEGKEHTFKADTVVIALGAESENKLAESLTDKVSELYVVGDCVSPRRIGEAMHEGLVAGWKI